MAYVYYTTRDTKSIARVKMSCEEGQNIFMSKNINSINILQQHFKSNYGLKIKYTEINRTVFSSPSHSKPLLFENVSTWFKKCGFHMNS